MSGPFSLRCLSPPCPGAVGGGHTQPLQGGMLWRSLCFFRKAKGRREIKSTLAFLASHEARRRMAVFSIQLAGSYTRPASREACCRAAVSPQPSRISLECSAPYGRGVGCRGSPPAASRGTCRATAVKPQPTRMSPYAPARLRRAVRKGAQPLRGTAPA